MRYNVMLMKNKYNQYPPQGRPDMENIEQEFKMGQWETDNPFN